MTDVMKFKTLPAAHHYAAQCARMQGRKWWVVFRHRRWYALPPETAERARRNQNWPGQPLVCWERDHQPERTTA